MREIFFDRKICQSLDLSLDKEWLETNGIGGYSSSTIIGANTRRQHGLLVASLKPPLERYTLLSNLEEAVYVGDRKYFLSTNFYPGTVDPHGYWSIVRFSLVPFPVTVYQIEDVTLVKTVFMASGENTVVISYKLMAGEEAFVRFELKPRLAFRRQNELARENEGFDAALETQKGVAKIRPYAELPPLYFYHNSVIMDKAACWYKNYRYLSECRKGHVSEEDLFMPFTLTYSFLKGDEIFFAASTLDKGGFSVEEMRYDELRRRKEEAEKYKTKNKAFNTALSSAEFFRVTRAGKEKTILAGYPWFGEWTRDALISLPGLLLTALRTDEAKSLLTSYANLLNRGLLPDRLPEAGKEPEYNSIDSPLWYIHAVNEFLEHTSDYRFAESIYPTLKKMMKFHIEGTLYNIKMEDDYLLSGGDETTNLTWMDARVKGRPVTPRFGKPVEVNALWYNALRIMEKLAENFNEVVRIKEYRELAEKAQKSFNKIFWNEKGKYLYDCVGVTGTVDSSVRPNQIFAVSLEHPVLDKKHWKHVVKKVESELLTPYGLRTLDRHHPDYKPKYEGAQEERDAAYHQGTVWSWLIGPYVSALLKVSKVTKSRKAKIEELFEPLFDHLFGFGLKGISEVFDGDSPHNPGGCPFQAWSTAELIRSYDEVTGIMSKYRKATEVTLR